jgi:hypothetical protein
MPYYTSIRNGPRHGFLAGPFRTHTEALALVDDARYVAHRVNPLQVAFAGFGTCSGEFFTPGVINDLLGVEIDADTGYARIRGALRSKYQLALHARITGVEWDQDYFDALESDRRKIEEYIHGRLLHSGCNGWLHTRRMQRRYPHINRQENEP